MAGLLVAIEFVQFPINGVRDVPEIENGGIKLVEEGGVLVS